MFLRIHGSLLSFSEFSTVIFKIRETNFNFRKGTDTLQQNHRHTMNVCKWCCTSPSYMVFLIVGEEAQIPPVHPS